MERECRKDACDVGTSAMCANYALGDLRNAPKETRTFLEALAALIFVGRHNPIASVLTAAVDSIVPHTGHGG